jgi:hypothetical protein
MKRSAPEISSAHRRLASRLRAGASRGWYKGDPESLQRYGAREILRSATEPELVLSLLFSRDRMHHSVGWWRNAEYEYCWHLSVACKAVDYPIDPDQWNQAPYEPFPEPELRYWMHAIFPADHMKAWMEPGGTDPRLTLEGEAEACDDVARPDLHGPADPQPPGRPIPHVCASRRGLRSNPLGRWPDAGEGRPMTVAVRMDMRLADAEAMADLLLDTRGTPAGAELQDQLWLVAVFVEQRKRTIRNERPDFTARANGILTRLDPTMESPA